ncbi:hypothetical protein IE81DRAFT_346426 [Ceraceosorus guamensis]|uniref:Uncharacterized protein n=1 Tax=Ceraceosorus guamensis TaxID=1522189 RepID=A0A316W1A1_9BASI|nr:hypothetical protein IE81DRAFT_346426 [Ceraceosorus guamensis]PWN43626.1 hypothetical protein IE81DRAFT_346426 [Ceraceosorus guamensis]
MRASHSSRQPAALCEEGDPFADRKGSESSVECEEQDERSSPATDTLVKQMDSPAVRVAVAAAQQPAVAPGHNSRSSSDRSQGRRSTGTSSSVGAGEGSWFFSSNSRDVHFATENRRASRQASKEAHSQQQQQQPHHHPRVHFREMDRHTDAVAAQGNMNARPDMSASDHEKEQIHLAAEHLAIGSQAKGQHSLTSGASATKAFCVVAHDTPADHLPITPEASPKTKSHASEPNGEFEPDTFNDAQAFDSSRSPNYGTFESPSSSSSHASPGKGQHQHQPSRASRENPSHGRVSGMHASSDSNYSNTLLGRYGTEPIDGYLNISARRNEVTRTFSLSPSTLAKLSLAQLSHILELDLPLRQSRWWAPNRKKGSRAGNINRFSTTNGASPLKAGLLPSNWMQSFGERLLAPRLELWVAHTPKHPYPNDAASLHSGRASPALSGPPGATRRSGLRHAASLTPTLYAALVHDFFMSHVENGQWLSLVVRDSGAGPPSEGAEDRGPTGLTRLGKGLSRLSLNLTELLGGLEKGYLSLSGDVEAQRSRHEESRPLLPTGDVSPTFDVAHNGKQAGRADALNSLEGRAEPAVVVHSDVSDMSGDDSDDQDRDSEGRHARMRRRERRKLMLRKAARKASTREMQEQQRARELANAAEQEEGDEAGYGRRGVLGTIWRALTATPPPSPMHIARAAREDPFVDPAHQLLRLRSPLASSGLDLEAQQAPRQNAIAELAARREARRAARLPLVADVGPRGQRQGAPSSDPQRPDSPIGASGAALKRNSSIMETLRRAFARTAPLQAQPEEVSYERFSEDRAALSQARTIPIGAGPRSPERRLGRALQANDTRTNTPIASPLRGVTPMPSPLPPSPVDSCTDPFRPAISTDAVESITPPTTPPQKLGVEQTRQASARPDLKGNKLGIDKTLRIDEEVEELRTPKSARFAPVSSTLSPSTPIIASRSMDLNRPKAPQKLPSLVKRSKKESKPEPEEFDRASSIFDPPMPIGQVVPPVPGRPGKFAELDCD